MIVSAQGNETDFVSRFFAPEVGINEDPVTGSAHTTSCFVRDVNALKCLIENQQLMF